MTPGDHITVTHRNRITRPAEVIDVRGDSLRIRYTDVEHVEVDTVLRARCKPHAGRTFLAAAKRMPPESRAALAEAFPLPSDDERPALRAVPKPPKPLRDAAYLRHVRAQPCCVSHDGASGPCSGPVVAHHHGPRGMGEKTDDYRTVPLCDGHHREFHSSSTIGSWDRASLDVAFAYVMSEQIAQWLRRAETDRGVHRKSQPWHAAIVDALIAHIRETAA